MGRLSRLDYRLRIKEVCESMSPQKDPIHSNYSHRTMQKTPMCRKCGMPMKGHSRSGCLISNSAAAEHKLEDDGVSMISSTPSFVIPEIVLSSASLTSMEHVYSVNTMQRRSIPTSQQVTPNWSRPSSPQPQHRVPRQQSPFVLDSASAASLVTALHPDSVFGVQPGDSTTLVAGIYQVPSTTVESFRTRALSNGIYCVPLNLVKEEEEERRSMQNVDLAQSTTWIITGPDPSDVDSLVAILQPARGNFS